MASVLLWITTVLLTSVLAWNLGVRQERGRQLRLEEIQRQAAQAVKRKKGTVLRTIRVRR